MRVFDEHDIILAHKPFDRSSGVAVYFASAATDQGPQSIRYRNNRIIDGGDWLTMGGWNLGGTNVTKTTAIAIVAAPTATYTFSGGAGYADHIGYFQVRPHADNVETPSLTGVRRVVFDGDGDPDDHIRGNGRLLGVDLCDAGGLRFRFVFDEHPDGVQPIEFRLTKTSGPGTVGDVTLDFVAGLRNYSIELTGLQDAQAYVFELYAQNGTVSKLLAGNNGTDIEATPDGSGPPVPTSLTASER